MEVKSNCPKCSGQMEQGFVIDNGYRVPIVSEWTAGAGPPQWSFWTGKIKSVTRQITTYRCTKCGFLESYAG